MGFVDFFYLFKIIFVIMYFRYYLLKVERGREGREINLEINNMRGKKEEKSDI